MFFPKQKFKAGDARKGYAIERPDPRLRFALCSGSHSDALVSVSHNLKRKEQQIRLFFYFDISFVLLHFSLHVLCLATVVHAKESIPGA